MLTYGVIKKIFSEFEIQNIVNTKCNNVARGGGGFTAVTQRCVFRRACGENRRRHTGKDLSKHLCPSFIVPRWICLRYLLSCGIKELAGGIASPKNWADVTFDVVFFLRSMAQMKRMRETTQPSPIFFKAIERNCIFSDDGLVLTLFSRGLLWIDEVSKSSTMLPR